MVHKKKRISASEALQHPYFQVSIPMGLDAGGTNEVVNTQRVAPSSLNINQPDSHRDRSEDSRRDGLEFQHTRDKDGEGSREPERNRVGKTTGYYLKQARYRPGVNLAALIKN